MLVQCGVIYGEADVGRLRNPARAYLELATRTGHRVSLGWANFLLGWFAYQENHLAEADVCFSRVLGIRYLVHVRAAVDSFSGLFLTKCAAGERTEAKNVLHILREFIVEQGAVSLMPLADSLALRLEPAAAGRGVTMADAAQIAAQLASDLWELPVLTTCRSALQSADVESLQSVEQSLAMCREYALSRNAKRQLIRIGAQQALLHEARGDRQPALAELRESVLLGEAGGALRYFVDEGPGLLPLLCELHGQGVAPSYISRILAAYARDAAADRAAASDRRQEQSTLSATAVALLSDLTNREMEVLLLLAKRLTNKEIAVELHISPRTVKKHTINLNHNLVVENRRQAVARAREVGIL